MSHFWPQKRPFTTKRHAITKDYDVSQKSLGVGINGKVLECYRKTDKAKFALKVRSAFNIVYYIDFFGYLFLFCCYCWMFLTSFARHPFFGPPWKPKKWKMWKHVVISQSAGGDNTRYIYLQNKLFMSVSKRSMGQGVA